MIAVRRVESTLPRGIGSWHEPPMHRVRVGLASATLALAAMTPGTALAYEGHVGVWLGAGYSGILGDTTLPPHAVAASAGVGIGLDDAWELRVRADYAYHVDSVQRGLLSADLVYVLDILSVVPYFGVGAGGGWTALPEGLRGDVVAGAILGVDVLLDRTWIVGVELRPQWVVTDLANEPFVLTALGRVQALFEI